MPRTVRASVGGIRYQVMNRGNARAAVLFERRSWSSLPNAADPDAQRFLAAGPVPRPDNWLEWVTQPQSDQGASGERHPC